MLEPPLRALRNTVNSQFAFVYPDAGRLAEGVSQGQVNEKQARLWASYRGYGDDAFTALVSIANVGPGMAQAFNLWRRTQIDEAGFRRALKRMGLEQEWIDALWKVREEILDPVQLANAIHRGLVADPGLLAVGPPTAEGKVPSYPVYPIDAIEEAHGSGYDRDRLGVLVGLQGLPMGSHEAAQAYFRGNITRDDYDRAIAEGNTRNEWGAPILEQSRQIPTARDFLENALRGYTDLSEAIAGAALHGMSPEHATLIYQNQGRPMNVRQITMALARGGQFQPEPGELTDPYEASIVEGSLKPAYYDLARALRYTMPSTFAIRQLAQSKVWDEAKTRERLLWSGWNPDDAADVAKAWVQGSSVAAKEATAADLLTLWDGQKLSGDVTRAALEALGYPADEAQRKMDVIEARRVAGAKQTAISDLHAAYKKGTINAPATTTALQALGLSAGAAADIVAAWHVLFDAEAASAPPAGGTTAPAA